MSKVQMHEQAVIEAHHCEQAEIDRDSNRDRDIDTDKDRDINRNSCRY